MKKDIIKICELLLNTISEFYEFDSQAKNFGTDTELYHSEIHMLQCIEENPGMHISGIARMLGVTRGAASQTANRLERKEMIIKKSSPDDNKKILLQLTLKGKTAYSNHKNAHDKYNKIIAEILSDADTEQLQFLLNFLISFNKTIKIK
ncbi:MAG: MarR family transcriptional regulator [Clostridia bacterium]|jgi:DNA-binding MarR family transcriptional regulator|nr:MarR family transcriptional regulator [Clostridia bacterium]MCI2013673.1 MarR family transcriptional regulator [Clostridia bacterium]